MTDDKRETYRTETNAPTDEEIKLGVLAYSIEVARYWSGQKDELHEVLAEGADTGDCDWTWYVDVSLDLPENKTKILLAADELVFTETEAHARALNELRAWAESDDGKRVFLRQEPRRLRIVRNRKRRIH